MQNRRKHERLPARCSHQLSFSTMANENYENIFYLDCPHFTVGRVDQWGEQGYLLFEGSVYSYEEDRKDQTGRTYSPMTITEFLTYAEHLQISIPEDFAESLSKITS